MAINTMGMGCHPMEWHLTELKVTQAIKDKGKLLMEQYQAFSLAFAQDYDAVKYNFKLPMKPEKFETHKNKWYFIELAKHFDNTVALSAQNPDVITESEYLSFLMFMYGEGYRNPSSVDVNWIADIRTHTGLAQIYAKWKEERTARFYVLKNNLETMVENHDLQTLEDFKKFITVYEPTPGSRTEPHMWHTIGRSPEVRANRSYSLTLQSFFLLDSCLHLLEAWNTSLKGEPEWDSNHHRLLCYKKFYLNLFPIQTIQVRRIVNNTLKFP